MQSNLSWGHSLKLDKPTDTIRIFLQNPDGLSASNKFRKFEILCQHLYTYDADVACLPETCTDWKRPQSLTQCSTLARKYWKQAHLFTSCSTVHATHRYLPGGTATMILGNLTGRIISSGCDNPLGRWSFVRLRGHDGIHVLIVTAYMVCKSSITSTGPTTAFRQQYSLLRASGSISQT